MEPGTGFVAGVSTRRGHALQRHAAGLASLDDRLDDPGARGRRSGFRLIDFAARFELL